MTKTGVDTKKNSSRAEKLEQLRQLIRKMPDSEVEAVIAYFEALSKKP